MSVQLRYAARSDVGIVRSNNQDSAYAGPHLLVLADGMGGPAGGDIASSVAVAHLAPLDEDTPGADDLIDLLRDAVESAHDELMTRSDTDPDLEGLGTTCIAILRSGTKLGMIHIGDSRAYLLRDGDLKRVTTDHTYVQHLVDIGRLTPAEAEHHPMRNMILRALGDTDGDVLLDTSVREAHPGDRWLLASDGLFGVVSEETITETLERLADVGECADELINLALRAGAPDNVTVIVCDIVGTNAVRAGDQPSTTPQIVGAAATDRLARTRASEFSGAAGRAANLRPRRALEEPEADARPKRRGRLLGRTLGAFLIALILGGALLAGYSWTRTQYYVTEDQGVVTVFQGIPQKIGPVALSEVHHRTDIKVADLPEYAKARLTTPTTRASLAEADVVVENFRNLIAPTPIEPPSKEPSKEATESPSPSARDQIQTITVADRDPSPSPRDQMPEAPWPL